MANHVVEMAGQRFGNWLVLERTERPTQIQSKQAWWNCRCVCGRVKALRGGDIRTLDTKSCGCQSNSDHLAAITKHGGAARTRNNGRITDEYRAWCGAKSRCYNPTCKKFANWGGRGIRMCERWRDDFGAFLADMGPRPTPAHS